MGKNITIAEFAQACRTAWSAVPLGAEKESLKIVALKLIGEAQKAALGKEFNDLEQFLGFLARMFDSNKPYCMAVGDLPKAKQRVLETVVEFSNRIKDIGRTIFMAANRENRREANSRIKGDMFIFFLKGL